MGLAEFEEQSAAEALAQSYNSMGGGGGFESRLEAEDIARAAQAGDVSQFVDQKDNLGISTSQGAMAKEALTSNLARTAEIYDPINKERTEKNRIAGAAYDAKSLADAEANGWMVKGVPVMEKNGKLAYDLNKIGAELGMSPEEIQKAAGTSFGTRKISATNRIDDMLGGQVGTNQSQANQKFQKVVDSEGVRDGAQAMISNLAGLDPNKAGVNFEKEDMLINLQKSGYMKDLKPGADQNELLNRGQGPRGLGKYAGVAMPAIVGTALSLMTAGAGSPLASAMVAGSFNTMKGLTEGDTSFGQIAGNFGKAAGMSALGSLGSYVGSGAVQGFKDAGSMGSDAASLAAAEAGQGVGFGTKLQGGLSGALEGAKDFGSAMIPDVTGMWDGAGTEAFQSPAQQIDQGYAGTIQPEYGNINVGDLTGAGVGLASDLVPQFIAMNSSNDKSSRQSGLTTGNDIGYSPGGAGQEDKYSDLQIRGSLY